MNQDCFAASGTICRACSRLFCESATKRGCAFFKTQEQAAKDVEAARRRIYSLPEMERQYIIEKYKTEKPAE